MPPAKTHSRARPHNKAATDAEDDQASRWSFVITATRRRTTRVGGALRLGYFCSLKVFALKTQRDFATRLSIRLAFFTDQRLRVYKGCRCKPVLIRTAEPELSAASPP